MSGDRKAIIAVIGAGKCSSDLKDKAIRAGAEIARGGGVVVCGGLGGIMEGAARGAVEAGGVAIGLLPGLDPQSANPCITYAIPTGLGEARNALVVRTADAVLAFPGSYGTLSEMAFALQSGTPLISVGAWDYGDPGRHAIMELDDPEAAAREALKLARTKHP